MMPTEEMIQAATKALAATGIQAPRERAIVSLNAAFAALDRDALIKAGAKALLARTPASPHAYSEKGTAETILRAVRLIA